MIRNPIKVLRKKKACSGNGCRLFSKGRIQLVSF